MEPREPQVASALVLLEASEGEALSYLGIQTERIEIARRREQAERPVPLWSDEDIAAKVLSAQRDSDSLRRYRELGARYFDEMTVKCAEVLRTTLCDGNTVRSEVSDLQDDAKAVVKYIATAILGMVAANVPGAIAAAAGSIATTIAIILLKRQISSFCSATPGTEKSMG